MIEFLIVMAVVSGVIAWLVKSVNSTGESRWLGLIVTLFGLQVVIGIGAVVLYARHQTADAARHEAALQQAMAAEKLALAVNRSSADSSLNELYEASNPPTPPMPETPQPLEEVDASAEESLDSNSTGAKHPATVIYQDVSFTWIGLIAAFGVFLLGVSVVFWGARKAPALVFAAVLGLLLFGTMFGISSTKMSPNISGEQWSTGQYQIARPAEWDAYEGGVIAPDPVIEGSLVTTQIPVTEEEVASLERIPEPKEIQRIEYTGLHRHVERMSELPEWASSTSQDQQVIPANDEVRLTSKRYSTVEEAERELWPIATSMVQQVLRSKPHDRYPTVVTRELLANAFALKEAVVVTWPFEVDGLSSEVYQVHWKLNVDKEVRESLHRRWSRQEVAQRLWLLGGGVGILTLLFGTGASIARLRERRHVA
ncbi:hypothetical protein AB1L42_18145 [Thalassoglobus sp. JC818]|uniref:hypothetical protein n=1 Tax=Thalassoglobus sp. JC818 TaxID=3232136 RepID=UPI003459917B